ncbi:MAG: hypothetical protein ABW123_23810 [Cystobacter sp.]
MSSELLKLDSRTPHLVSSFNEWDPLEEVIVGVIQGASIPQWDVTLRSTMPEEHWDLYKQNAGKPFEQSLVDAAAADLEQFVHILEAEGVTVRRPDVTRFARPYQTPEWQAPGGLYAAMPRDLLLVVGEELIEAPMPWRSRYFEINAYRPLLREYFRQGAKWTSAPKPQLSEPLYNANFEDPVPGGPMHYAITEFEPVFDAADFTRCGRDIFYQLSNVTNQFGVDWLARHLGPTYRLHPVHVTDTHPMHIDASFVPLAPGKLLINPDRVKTVPPQFKSWDVFVAPRPWIPDSIPFYMSSKWLTMNVLMLDERRVMVERQDEPMLRAFKSWGFKPIPCDFLAFNKFGGSFHCATLDVRRRGPLQSYF